MLLHPTTGILALFDSLETIVRTLLYRIFLSVLITGSVGVFAGRAAAGDAGARDFAKPTFDRNVALLDLGDLDGGPRDDRNMLLQPMIADPIRPLNRVSFAITKPLVDYVGLPLAKGWRFLLPEPVCDGVGNVGYNWSVPVRVVGLLLQGRLVDTGRELQHFGVNTTLGVLGIRDAAGAKGMVTHREDIGQALGAGGIGPGCYLFMPILGPSSARDLVGRVGDYLLNPASYVLGLNAVFGFNTFASRSDAYRRLRESQPDLYLPMRALWAVQREAAVRDYVVPEDAWLAADPEPSLGVLMIHPQDPAFAARAQVRRVRSPRTGRKVPYSLWLRQPDAPLVVIIPGIGAHRTSALCLALAEEAYARGYSVVALSNPFHPEFIRTGLSARYPGYTPSDAIDLRGVIAALCERLPIRPASLHLLGYSLGGLVSLHLVADKSDGLIFDSCVAVNPPVDLLYSVSAFDGYFREPAGWQGQDRRARLEELALRLYTVLIQPDAQRRGLPFTRAESEFVVALKSRHTAWTAVTACEGIPPSPGESRDPLLAWNTLSFRDYVNRRLLPSVAGDGRGVGELAEKAGLRSVATALADPRVRVVTNRDDFILAPEHVEWLKARLGSRLHLNDHGGHLGNLHREEVRKTVFQALSGW